MEPNWQLWANNDFNLYNNFISGTCSKFSVIRYLRFNLPFDLTVVLTTLTEVVNRSASLTTVKSAVIILEWHATF